ncbi:MAG TPA: adenylosuccinate synthetase [Candidatus Angelobacter sp.]|jgi:adenylosuccinate synthase
MSLWVVVGGQFGSEGKGKIAAHIAVRESIDICIRCGGPNSGHSVTTPDGTVVLRQIPTGYINPATRLLIPAGALINLNVIKDEIERFKVDPVRIGIDHKTMVIEEKDQQFESDLKLQERLSSTLCGVGSAVARRVLRGADVRLARDAASVHPWLKPLLTDVSVEANSALDRNQRVLVEGTQGFGLSLYHADPYPKTTSRDTTAAAFLSEVGLSPALVTEIVLVLRTFPIRVAGKQAGPLHQEISWDTLQSESRYPWPIVERTSVTNKIRRIGRFDWQLAKAAVRCNRPTKLAINCLDYLDYRDLGCTNFGFLSDASKQMALELETQLGVPIAFCGVGPAVRNLIEPTRVSDLRGESLVLGEQISHAR